MAVRDILSHLVDALTSSVGSITVYPYENTSLPALELGASIFVKANKNLWRASEEFNLTRKDTDEGAGGGTGVWDGKEIILSVYPSWWIWRCTLLTHFISVQWRLVVYTQGIMALRYPFSSTDTSNVRNLIFTRSLSDIICSVNALIDKFLTLYTPDAPKWDNISDLASSLGWLDMVGNSTDRYLMTQGVSKKYTHELVEAATRVNYGQVCLHLLIPHSPSHRLLQDVVDIHALEGAVSMAATGASAVKGGNFQIFEQFLNRSGAKVFLNTPVRPSHLDTYIINLTYSPRSRAFPKNHRLPIFGQ